MLPRENLFFEKGFPDLLCKSDPNTLSQKLQSEKTKKVSKTS